jgi:hypothetical protein
LRDFQEQGWLLRSSPRFETRSRSICDGTGGDKAWCDPFTYWCCARTECNHCYRADIGYFDLDRQRGDSVRLHARAPERCHRHTDLTFDPFMWIANSGKGRRFACPIKGCRCVGPAVAEFVSDVGRKEEPRAAMAILRGEAKKAAFELSVFNEFAKAALLSADAPENGGRGFPDVRCKIDGQEYWFELGRITDEILAEQINRVWPKNPRPFTFGQEEPFERIMKQKATKTYQTNGRPVDLVLHFDHQPPDRKAIQRHVAQHAGTLDELAKRFSRVWIYDGWSKSVLWRSAG